MPTPRLTWYVGSILPFASLWHTLMRVAALNALRLNELPDADVDRSPGYRSTALFRPALLYNDAHGSRKEGVSTRALARWLGEPETAFAWSHLGRIPKCLRGLVHDGFRICPQCLALGYHSALLSLRLLDACPIHGCALLGQCYCGRPFDPHARTGALAHSGCCVCGQMAFFTHETCRRPALAPDDTRPLNAVAHWLESFIALSRPVAADAHLDAEMAAQWLAHTRSWSEAFDLAYPQCFVPGLQRNDLRVVETSGPRTGLAPSGVPPRAAQHRQEGRYWDVNPATLAYRSMLRYLRRHVARGSEPFIADFLQHPDPVHMANVMRSNCVAVAAFAEWLWATRLELHVLRRRWPYRAVVQGQGGDYVGHIETPRPALETGSWAGHDPVWRHWVEYQAARCLLLSCWRQAQQRAMEAVHSGVADTWMDWGDEPWRWATAHTDSGIRWVNLESQPACDWALPLPDKSLRRERQRAAAQRRQQVIEEACTGLCLTWSERDGWQVERSLAPGGARAKRHRLLGIGHDRPTFWLFEREGQFMARACDVKLQVRAGTARAAIDALRAAFGQYRHVYPAAPPYKLATK